MTTRATAMCIAVLLVVDTLGSIALIASIYAAGLPRMLGFGAVFVFIFIGALTWYFQVRQRNIKVPVSAVFIFEE